MSDAQRLWLLCRVCGATHENPASSSICPSCGAEERKAREAEEDRLEQERLDRPDPVTAAKDAAYGFNEEQLNALGDMFQAFYDAMQEVYP